MKNKLLFLAKNRRFFNFLFRGLSFSGADCTAGLDFKQREKDKEGDGRKELETEIKGDRRREI
jgi:hypothetical protein